MPTFTDFIPTFPTVNRKFLITDFRLLSTSVKRENFIDFYRSQKKVKDPRSLQTRDVLAGLFVPLGESEQKTCSVENRRLLTIARINTRCGCVVAPRPN